MSSVSHGYLPLAPLGHDEATATGMIDLSLSLRPRATTIAATSSRDQMLLVRLHGEPLGFVHIDLAPGSESPMQVADAVWNQVGDRVVAHATRFGCMAPPLNPDALLGDLGGGDGCPGQTPVRPPGRAAIVIATVGRLDALERALTSVVHLDCPDFEVILVDNNPSRPGTRQLAERFAEFAAVRYIAEPRPGLAVARNAGVAAAEGAAYVAFTDDDVIVDPGWLSWLLAPFADQRVRATTGMVLPLELASPTQKRFELYSGFGKGVVPETYDMSSNRADHRLLYPFWGGMFGSGNSMAFRRRTVIDMGGFDPALGAGTPTGGGEDIAAFTDVILRGGRLIYEPRSICWHEHRDDDEALRKQVYNYGVGFTATLWRFAWRDPRFLAAMIRGVPIMARVLVARHDERASARLPADLARLEFRGRLAGPWRYEQSRRAVRRDGSRGAVRRDGSDRPFRT